MKVKVKKEVNIMFPEMTTRIKIDYANEVSSNKGVPYVAVGHTNDRGYQNNFWFPVSFLDFAKEHVGKEVTATFRYFSSKDRTYISGLSLSE